MSFFGLNFMSKEDRERQHQEYIKRIFPLGEVESKSKLLNVLHELCTGKTLDEELLFVFITAKDIYLSSDDKIESFDKMINKINKKQRWVSIDNLRLIATLIYLESDITSLDDYPTADAVRAASLQYPITESFS